MPHPTPEAHKAATSRELEIQTDKAAFKIVPCTHAGCNTDLVVNTFYAPAKGKCSAHNGKTKTAIAVSHLVHDSPSATPNGALAKLLCPMCSMPMAIVKVAENGSSITFVCQDGVGVKWNEIEKAETERLRERGTSFCGCSVTVKPTWRAMEMRNIPTEFAKVVAEFNLDAKMRYFDANEARHGAPTA